MARSLKALTLLVPSYDEAIAYYTGVLDFALIEDTDLGHGKRWVLIAPSADSPTRLLLAQAATSEQQAAIGNQAGGRVFLFLHSDSFWDDYLSLQGRGVTFLEKPRQETYGNVVVFIDRFGNKWDLLGPPGPQPT